MKTSIDNKDDDADDIVNDKRDDDDNVSNDHANSSRYHYQKVHQNRIFITLVFSGYCQSIFYQYHHLVSVFNIIIDNIYDILLPFLLRSPSSSSSYYHLHHVLFRIHQPVTQPRSSVTPKRPLQSIPHASWWPFATSLWPRRGAGVPCSAISAPLISRATPLRFVTGAQVIQVVICTR